MATHRQLPPHMDISPFEEKGRWYHAFIENTDSHPISDSTDYRFTGIDPGLHLTLVRRVNELMYPTAYRRHYITGIAAEQADTSGGDFIPPNLPEYTDKNPTYLVPAYPLLIGTGRSFNPENPDFEDGTAIFIVPDMKLFKIDNSTYSYYIANVNGVIGIAVRLYEETYSDLDYNINSNWIFIPMRGVIATSYSSINPYSSMMWVVEYDDVEEGSTDTVRKRIPFTQILDLPISYSTEIYAVEPDALSVNTFAALYKFDDDFVALDVKSSGNCVQFYREYSKTYLAIPGGIDDLDLWVFGYYK